MDGLETQISHCEKVSISSSRNDSEGIEKIVTFPTLLTFPTIVKLKIRPEKVELKILTFSPPFQLEAEGASEIQWLYVIYLIHMRRGGERESLSLNLERLAVEKLSGENVK